MSTDVMTSVVVWHESDVEKYTASARPGVSAKPRDFIDRENGVAFRVSTTTKSQGDDRSFHSPRHRHTFDQVRFYYKGRMKYGRKEEYGDGDLLYLPGGTHYGPMEFADDGEIKHLNFQFSGMSGIPYYGTAEFAPAKARLEQTGRFENGIYHHADGHNQDGWEAMLEETIKRPVTYPEPALGNYVVVRTGQLAWRSVPDSPGVEVKHIGHFTEIGPNVALFRLSEGASIPGGSTPVQQVWTLWDGKAIFGDQPDREFEPVAGRYVPAGVPSGEVRATADNTVLLRIEIAKDGELFLPNPTL